MCMLTFLPPNVQPNTDRLRNGTVSNRDGHGWAIVVCDPLGIGSHIITGHSMNPDAAIEAFRLAREAHPQGPALFHSRFTTGGLVDESNCHPYVVNGDPRTVLAHNGILCDMEQARGDVRSDTRAFADDLGYLLYPGAEPGTDFNLNSRRGRRRLREWITNGNKFVILTVDPVFKRNHYVVNSNQGIWEDDGCWYSNTGYKARTWGTGNSRYYSSGGSGWGWADDWGDDTYAPKPYVSPHRSGTVWERLALAAGESRAFIDKGASGPLPDDPDLLTCEICGAKNAMAADLNYCRICGTCGDCYGDTFDEYSDKACDCGWPTGTHPGRRMSIESAFAVRDAVDSYSVESESTCECEDCNEDCKATDKDAPVTLGPPQGAESAPPVPAWARSFREAREGGR